MSREKCKALHLFRLAKRMLISGDLTEVFHLLKYEVESTKLVGKTETDSSLRCTTKGQETTDKVFSI